MGDENDSETVARIPLPQVLAALMAAGWVENGSQFAAKEGVLERFAFLSAGKSSPSYLEQALLLQKNGKAKRL